MTLLNRFMKSVAAVCAVSALCVPIASAQLFGGKGGGIVLFEGSNFSGEAVEITGDVRTLNDARFNDEASSIRVLSGSWIVCDDADFRGRCQTISRDVSDLRSIGLNNNISSVRPAGGFGFGGNTGQSGGVYDQSAPIILFSDTNFRGDPLSITGNVDSLSRLGFNDRAESVKINRGVWLLCHDADLRGRCEYVDRDVDDLRDIGLRDNISSIAYAPNGAVGQTGGFGNGNDGFGNRGNSGRGYGNGRSRQRGGFGGRGEYRQFGGFEGQDSVFFPRPTDQAGSPIRNGSGQATRFCQSLGFDGAAYKGRGSFLIDVVCEK